MNIFEEVKQVIGEETFGKLKEEIKQELLKEEQKAALRQKALVEHEKKYRNYPPNHI